MYPPRDRVVSLLADRHQSDPDWNLSRMAVFWTEGARSLPDNVLTVVNTSTVEFTLG